MGFRVVYVSLCCLSIGYLWCGEFLGSRLLYGYVLGSQFWILDIM